VLNFATPRFARGFYSPFIYNETRERGLEHNERLEFLGDAVVELVVTNFLYKKYPQANEGELTSYRAALVNAITLGNLGID